MPKNRKKGFWGHFNNFLLLILSGGFFWLGASFLEYDITKIQKPGLLPIITPKALTLIISGAIIIASILILSMLVIIYKKGLENRGWLWGLIFLQSVGLIILSQVLGYHRFIWILFPNTFSIFSQ